MVYKPPPKRNTADAITIMDVMSAEGFAVEILLNHRLIENDMDEACFLTFRDIFCFLFLN
jgi:hypothetical protein